MEARRGERAPGLRAPELAGIAFIALALRLALLLRPLVQIDDLSLIDDSYLSLHLARSITRGLGPFYETGFTNGFQPLYVFLMAPVYAIFPRDAETPIRIAIALLAAFDVAGMLILHRLLARSAPSRLACGAALLLWALNPAMIRTATNGLETSIAFCLIAACLLRIARVQEEPSRTRSIREGAILGGLIGLAALARIDSLLLAPVAALEWTLAARRGGVSLGRAAGTFAIAGAVALAVQAPWLAWSWHWTGTLFPVSGRAVRFLELSNVRHAPTLANFYLPVARKAAEAIAGTNLVALAAGALLALALPLARRSGSASEAAPGVPASWRSVTPLARLRPAALFAALLVVAYAGFVFGHWHFPRYLFPVAIPMTLALAALIDAHVAAWGRSPAARAALGAALALMLVAAIAEPPFEGSIAESHPRCGATGASGCGRANTSPRARPLAAPRPEQSRISRTRSPW